MFTSLSKEDDEIIIPFEKKTKSPKKLTPELTFKLKKSFGTHTKNAWTVINFGSPYNKLVSGSQDETVKIYDSESYKCLKTINDHKSWINIVIKYKDDIFLAGSSDKSISSYSIIPPYFQKKCFTNASLGKVYHLMKIPDEDIVLSLCNAGGVHVIDWAKGTVLRILKEQRISTGWNKLCLSKKISGGVFIATEEKIAFFNYLDNFEIYSINQRNLCYSMATNIMRGKEYLYAVFQNNIEIYNVDHGVKMKTIKPMIEGIRYSCQVIGERYLIAAGVSCHITIFDLKLECREIGNFECFQKGETTYPIYEMAIVSKKDRYLEIVCGSDICNFGRNFDDNRSCLRIYEIRGLKLPISILEKQNKLDLEERVEFLVAFKKEYIFENVVSPIFVTIRLKNKDLEYMKVVL